MTKPLAKPATTRAQQRESTRDRIVEAALAAFAEKGFRGASTRDIAQRADTNQGLITYHFKSKDDLWRAAADRIFGLLRQSIEAQLGSREFTDSRDRARAAIRSYVRFAASRPELFRLMVDEGKNSEERMKWLVDTHLKPRFDALFEAMADSVTGNGASMFPHVYYVMAGGGSMMFAVAPECRRLTGMDPETEEAVERHAEFLAQLLVP